MRMMLKAVVDTEAGNEAIRSGVMLKAMEQMMEQLKPEAAYFLGSEDGQRSCLVVFDLAEPSQIPSVSEPLFQMGKAKVTLTPCMSLDEVLRGLSQVPAM